MRRPADAYGVTDQSGLRTLLVGLGGVCERTLRPHVEAGRASTVGDLIADGAAASMASQVVPETHSAWPSLYTGVNPGRHGVFGRRAFDGRECSRATFRDVREHALWELLDRRGRSSVVVNVPVTAPPSPFDGALVSGWGGPDRPACHPEGALAALDGMPDDYRVYVPGDATGDERVAWSRRLAAARATAFVRLVDRVGPDFGFLGFHQTKTVFRDCPDDPSAQAAVFDAVDDAVATAVEATDPDTVVLASDHGVAPLDGPSFRVNDFLHDRDLLSTTRGGTDALPPRPAADSGHEPDGRSLGARLAGLAAKAGATSQRVASLLDRVGLDGLAGGVLPRRVVWAATERVDRDASVAYARSGERYGVRVNCAGRDPDGVVSPAEYQSVRSDLVDALRTVRTPDGERVFSAVGPAEQFFGGPHVEAGPDVVTVPRRFDVHLDAALCGTQFGDPERAYANVPRGLLALAGDGVDESASVSEPHLFDVAPTVLASLGVPPSTRMDGDVLAPVDTLESTEYAPFTDGPPGDSGPSRRLSRPGQPDGEEP
ncbi:alkaline phosphatase family protein [Halobacterium jilantaiense]|uniref:Predicted phosphohydrolase or phosphomutase, AlkP superfamily n=1 Tax=Halobacterium jilantaiense TaxID=355548 RepID=A0A1I0MQC6_9EURY|nr:alkaline phosphatase family protein [Halobacterium jilantaiense]SEV90392.1 Predicted phosphohydrolase or phosphomutase, AlkP superfamily [Halobacterium jilantaiense]